MDLEHYFTDIPTSCPYGIPHKAIYRQARFGSLPDPYMEYFLARGYRRNGNIIYRMVCPGCQACVPIRLTAAMPLQRNRSQRRVWARNGEVAAEIGPLEVTAENVEICQRFFNARYPGRGNDPQEYYSGFFMNSITTTMEVRYRQGERLIGVAIVDLCGRSLNAVYFYFDPEEARRSPGVYNILRLHELCRQHGLEHLYLGFLIREVPAMRYKANFKPHALFIDGRWQQIY